MATKRKAPLKSSGVKKKEPAKKSPAKKRPAKKSPAKRRAKAAEPKLQKSSPPPLDIVADDAPATIDSAREQRKAARELRKLAASGNAMPAIVTSGSSLAEAKSRREQLDAKVAQVFGDAQPIEFKLDELLRYKLLHRNEARKKHLDRVKSPLVTKVQKQLDEEIEVLRRKRASELDMYIQEAVTHDEVFLQADADQVETINEVLAKYEQQLPEGYAITFIDPEAGVVRGVVSDQRGSRLSSLRQRQKLRS